MALVRNRNSKDSEQQTSYSRLSKLNCFDEFYSRLLQGWDAAALAKYIHEIARECPDIRRTTLVEYIKKYRMSIPKTDLLQKASEVKAASLLTKAIANVQEGLDEVQELESLYRLQLERIHIDFATEKKIRKLMPTLGNEVKIAKEILGKLADMKMDLGITDRHIGKMEVETRVSSEMESKYGAGVSRVLEDPASRQKFLTLTSKLLQLKATDSKEVAEHTEDAILVQSSDDPLPSEIESIHAEVSEEVMKDLFKD